MGLSTRHFYEFGSFRLEAAEHLLLRENQPVSLTPKAFELLVFLLQNPGRLVTKDQIMQAVWPGAFVEEANLTVWISVLRKTLGESEGGLRYIETVPKKGYRFAAPVREVRQPDEGPSGPALTESQFAPRSSAAAAAVSVPQMNTAEARNTAADVPLQLSPEAVPNWRHRVAIPALAVLVCLLAVMGYCAYQRGHNSAAHASPRRLAILPLHNLKQDAGDDFLGFSLSDAVITKLGSVSSLAVRPSSAIEKYRNQTIDIPKVATDLNVDTLLTGNFIREGDDLRITYQLIDVKSDKILGRGTIDLKYDKLLTVQDEVAQQIIKELELNLSPSEAERIRLEEPVNPLAYEYYLRGVDLYGRHEFPLAIKMLEKSAEIDPKYALTWAYLGSSYTSAAAFEFGGREQYRRARAAYERALALQPQQLEAHVFLANLLVDTGKVGQAVPLLRDALKNSPNNAAIHWELGYAYRFGGMLNESVAECKRAREIDPLVKGTNGSVLNTYLYLGEYDNFLSSLPDPTGSAFILFYRGFGEYYLKNWQQAAADFDHAYELDPTLYTQIGKALSDSISHQNSEGLEILHQVENKIQQQGVGDPEGIYKVAQAYAALGDKASAMRTLRMSIENGFFPYPYFATDPLLDSLRREQQFPLLMNLAQQRHEAFKAKFF
jgi:DNA-binding winged helix-turn-helix (wHTH) protein/TolB-like protein/Tfp pilus assembly protein PilF